jgi:hypothetical protein
VPRANRRFLGRAVRFAADQGLGNPDVTRLIDFSQPLAVLFVAACSTASTWSSRA